MVYLEYYNTRFWRCEHVAKKTVKITYGKCGSEGRTILKTDFEIDEDAEKYVAKMTKRKMIDGYVDNVDPQPNNDHAALDIFSAQGEKRKAPEGTYPNKISAVDSEVSRIDKILATTAEVHNDFNARLALVEPSDDKDLYYILQLLVDGKKKKRKVIESDTLLRHFYVYSRWGTTGTKGTAHLEGPFDIDHAERRFCDIFRTKTGTAWGKAKYGEGKCHVYGKYECLPPITHEQNAKWYYYLTFDPLGKPDGWYEYDSDNASQTEALYGDYEQSHRATRFATRLVHSNTSGFTYSVNLKNMTQTNTRTGTTRPIERTTSGLPPTRVPNINSRPKSTSRSNTVAFGGITRSVLSNGTAKTTAVPVTQKSRPTTAKRLTVKPAVCNVVGHVDAFASSQLRSGSIYGEYNIMLNQTNLDANNNKYYKIQLIRTGCGFYLYTRWGRVGEDGRYQEVGPMDSAQAIKKFEEKFHSKTRNEWQNRDNFEPKPQKYTVVEMERDSSAAKIMALRASAAPLVSPAVSNITSSCKLESETKGFVDLIFNEDMFKSAMSEMNLDPAKLPLGALSKTQISKGFAALELIENEINTTADATKLMSLTSDFYTIIPHAFGRRRGPVLNTHILINEKYEMLNTLGDIEMAQSMQKDTQTNTTPSATQSPHPSDLNYEQLAADLDLVNEQDREHKIIHQYFTNTKQKGCNRMALRHIWRVNRHNESTRFSAHASLSNRKLLWHGTNVAVVAAILKSGLRIMPHSGGRVGRGIYLADQHAKSAGYVGSARGTGIMFLVEAALGTHHEIVRDDPSLVSPPDGYDSVLAKGRQMPDQEFNVELDIDGNAVTVPQGVPVNDISASKSSFYHNEFLVYKESQHRIRYVLTFDM